MSQQQQQNNVFQIQQQIKQNAEEMNEYLTDLKNWVKQKSSSPSSPSQQQDQSSSSTTTTNRTLPPIRNTTTSTTSSPTLTKKPLIEQVNNKPSSSSSPSPSSSKNDEENDEPNEVQALSLKNQGNHFFRNKQFEKALEYYTKSLSFKQDAIVYCNRSAAHFQLHQFSSSELDSSKAIALDHSYAKAYARRAFARKELKNWEGSIQDFEIAIKLDSKNQEAVRELALVKKRWNEQQGENLPKRRMMIEEVEEDDDDDDDDENEVIEELVTPFASKLESSHVKQQQQSKSKLREEKEVKTGPSSVKSEQVSGTTFSKISSSSPSITTTKVEQQQQKSMTTSAIPKIKVKIPSHAPNNSYEFEKAFNELDREDFYEYLKMIPPNSFGKLFKESLTEKILNSIVEALESVFTRTEELAERALQVMSNLTRVGRFDMLVMFLNDEEKQRIERLFDSLQQKLPSDKIGELKQVRAKYA